MAVALAGCLASPERTALDEPEITDASAPSTAPASQGPRVEDPSSDASLARDLGQQDSGQLVVDAGPAATDASRPGPEVGARPPDATTDPPEDPLRDFVPPAGTHLATQVLACALWKWGRDGWRAPYEIVGDGEGIRVYGTKFARYLDDWGWTWVVMHPCAELALGRPIPDYVETAVGVAELAGLPLLVEPFGANATFHAYNPEVIRWAAENLVPDPAERIDGHGLAAIYRVVFAAFVRRIAETYVYLQDRGIYQSEVDAFWDWLQEINFEIDGDFECGPGQLEGYSWTVTRRVWCHLARRFGMEPPPSGERAWAEADSASSALEAAALWLRRGMDGTHDEVWSGVSRVLRLYDAEWYAELRRTYPNAHIDW